MPIIFCCRRHTRTTMRPYSNRTIRRLPFGRRIWRTLMMPRTGLGFNDGWIPELMYSTWATTDQTRGIQQVVFFNEETFEPHIGNRFERAMNVWTKVWPDSVKGRFAVGFALPGFWKGTFVSSGQLE
mmetsp:Transcript_12785/g.20727  ORF Transcript_12785/g.20727 Transcript_12785/m.20727 type:complete len:127 (+) Transcript_12785:66-446(+)